MFSSAATLFYNNSESSIGKCIGQADELFSKSTYQKALNIYTQVIESINQIAQKSDDDYSKLHHCYSQQAHIHLVMENYEDATFKYWDAIDSIDNISEKTYQDIIKKTNTFLNLSNMKCLSKQPHQGLIYVISAITTMNQNNHLLHQHNGLESLTQIEPDVHALHYRFHSIIIKIIRVADVNQQLAPWISQQHQITVNQISDWYDGTLLQFKNAPDQNTSTSITWQDQQNQQNQPNVTSSM